MAESVSTKSSSSTIVLTSAYKRYVDVRVFNPLPNEIKPFLPIDRSGENSSARLDWAFAGISSSKPAELSNNGAVVRPGHSTWYHWVDNKTLDPAADEGYMYPTYGTNLTTERGAMVNPRTGVLTEYEEVWQDLEISKCGEDEVFVSWVACLGGPHSAPSRKGVLCRIGQWIQGVLRVNESDMRVMRWKWHEDRKDWLQELGIGDFPLNPKLLDPPSFPMHIGMQFETGLAGLEEMWSIAEVHYWPGGLSVGRTQFSEEGGPEFIRQVREVGTIY